MLGSNLNQLLQNFESRNMKIKYFQIILVVAAIAAITAKYCCAIGIEPVNHQEDQNLIHGKIALEIVLSAFAVNNVNPIVLVLNLISTSNTYRTSVLLESIFEFWRNNPIFQIRLESVDKLAVLAAGRLRRICILILDTLQDFDAASKKLNTTMFMLDGFFIFVFIDATPSDLSYIFEACWKLGLPNVLIVYQKSNEIINVDSYVPFNPEKCRDTRPVTIVSINNHHKINSHPIDYFPHKISNLHKCPVFVGTSVFVTPAVLVDKRENGSFELSGRDVSLVKVIAARFNFTPVYKLEFETPGYIFANGSAGGTFKSLLDGEVDIIIGDLWLKYSRLEFFQPTMPYSSGNIIFIVPKGKPLTTVEKFIFPFEKDLWIACIVFYLTGSLVISMVNCQSENVRNFIFGRNVKFPHLNMFAGLIGNTQPRLPGRNFARFILMNYLMFFIVIRTSYIGAYHNVVINMQHHKEIETIQELLDSDIEIRTYKAFVDYMGSNPEIVNKISYFFKNHADVKESLEKVATGKDIAICVSKDEVVYANYKNFIDKKVAENQKRYFHICKESFMTTHVVMYSSRSFFLMNKLDPIIDDVKSAGLALHWERETYDQKLDILKVLKSMERPKPTSLTQLRGPLILFLLCCAFCCLVFALEIISKHFAAKLKKDLF